MAGPDPQTPKTRKNTRPRSSLHRRLPATIRDQLDEAIFGRTAGLKTYQQIYDHFNLGPKFNISFSAFKRYAHKLSLADRRMLQATMAAFVYTGKDESEFTRANTENALALLLSTVLDCLLDPPDHLNPQQIYHLALAIRAYHLTSKQVHDARTKTFSDQAFAALLEEAGGIKALAEPMLERIRAARRSAKNPPDNATDPAPQSHQAPPEARSTE